METQSALARAFYLLRNGYLVIDSHGRIWRTHIYSHGIWRPIKPRRRAENVGGKGYLRLTLQIAGVGLKSVMAHRIVWEWINGPIPPGLQVNHKDLNKTNNAPSNLELLTGAGNIQHSYANGRPAPWHKTKIWRGKPRISEIQKLQIREMRKGGAILKEIGIKFNIGTTHVQRICASAGKGGNAID